LFGVLAIGHLHVSVAGLNHYNGSLLRINRGYVVFLLSPDLSCVVYLIASAVHRVGIDAHVTSAAQITNQKTAPPNRESSQGRCSR
jgi:hypothetical protein